MLLTKENAFNLSIRDSVETFDVYKKKEAVIKAKNIQWFVQPVGKKKDLITDIFKEQE